MDFQIKAGFRKELLAFVRSRKFFILACVYIGLSIFNPLMLKGMGMIMDTMSDTYGQLGVDISIITDQLGTSASLAISSALSELSSTGLLVFLLVINSFAGGEQKKRSVIIPQISGLGSTAYILPKFIIYPLTVFVISLVGALAAAWVSALIFDINDIVVLSVVAAGAVIGVYNMLYVCLHIALGTGTGKAGMSSAICIVASYLLPNFLAVLNTTPTYNPFTLNLTASSVLYGEEAASSILAAVAISVVLMAFAYYIAIFVQKAKKIDNSGNEVLI